MTKPGRRITRLLLVWCVLFASCLDGGSTDCPCDQGDLLDCEDFDSMSDAQSCFEKCMDEGMGDVHVLDSDNDGDACESI